MDRITPKPTPLIVRPEFIPVELKSIRAWVTWRYEWNGNKWTKRPYRANHSSKASTTDPTSWGSFRDAMSCYSRGGFDGIGFVLHPRNRIVGIDLDHCIEASTAVWAIKIIIELNSYTELSPSGNGVRIFVRGTLPAGGRKKDLIEMYDTGRFLTVTGHRRAGSPQILESREQAIQALHLRIFSKPKVEQCKFFTLEFLGDAQVLERAFRARNGDKVEDLYRGRIDSRYNSHSQADLALCRMLAFYTDDISQIDRLFRSSGLFRDKWDERHYGDGRTYGEGTILKALEGR
jgi:primase-polymerase (primpol)-like protein